MFSKGFMIFGALAIIPAFAQGPEATLRRHAPISILAVQDGQTTSSNWSGYAVTGSGFTNATGSWIVPTAKCSSGTQYSSFWVGIDGYSSSTVEQTGTDADCSRGRPQYYAWYEFFPAYPVTITSVPVKPGDRIAASIKFAGGSNFTIFLKDITTGKVYSKTGSVSNAQRTSAEWIAEAPSSASVLPLADFGTGLFGYDNSGINRTCDAVETSHSGPIGTFPSSNIQEITMEKKSVKEAVPSSLSSDGTSFSVQWYAQ
jgi:Peptidase A4 family